MPAIRPAYMAMFSIAIAFLLAISANLQASQAAQPAANASLSNAIAYVNVINQSSFLIFTPNLTASYYYLNVSNSTKQSNPAKSIAYSNKAVDAASASYAQISMSRNNAAIAMLAFILIMTLIVGRLMKPVENDRYSGYRKSGRKTMKDG